MGNPFKVGDKVRANTVCYGLKEGDEAIVTSINANFVRVNGKAMGSIYSCFDLVKDREQLKQAFNVGDILFHTVEERGRKKFNPMKETSLYRVTKVSDTKFTINGMNNCVRGLDYLWKEAEQFEIFTPVRKKIGDKVTIEVRIIENHDPDMYLISGPQGGSFYVSRTTIEGEIPAPIVEAPKPYEPKEGDVVTWGAKRSYHKVLWTDKDNVLVKIPGQAPLLLQRNKHTFEKK